MSSTKHSLPQEKILFLGYGKLGQTFYRSFHSQYQIRGIKRTPMGGDPCLLSLMPIQSWEIVPELDWGNIFVFSPSSKGGTLETFRDTYLTNLVFVLDRLKELNAGMKRLIFIGSTGVYPKAQGRIWTEDSEIPQENPRQAILLEAERAIRHSVNGFEILRCGGLYGPGRGNFSWVARRGRIESSDLSNQYLSLVHQEDVCQIVHQLIQRKASHETFNVVDDSQLKRAALLNMVAEITGIPIVKTGPPPLIDDRFVDNSKIKKFLDYRFQYSMTPTFLKEHLIEARSAGEGGKRFM